MYCTNCGKKLEEDSRFCTFCGQTLQNQELEMGKIIFHRINRILGCAVGIKIYIDGEFIGNISNGGTIEHAVSIGNHKISFSLWSGANVEEVNVTSEFPNVYLDIKLKLGIITNKTRIVNIRSEK